MQFTAGGYSFLFHAYGQSASGGRFAREHSLGKTVAARRDVSGQPPAAEPSAVEAESAL